MENSNINGKTENRLNRDREFLQLYTAVLKLMIERGAKHPRKAAIAFTIHNGAPHYHVSYKRAYEVVRQLLRGKHVLRPSLQTAMWLEITERVRSLMKNEKLSIAAALDFVLEHCRASRFFISERYARIHIYRAMRERRHTITARYT